MFCFGNKATHADKAIECQQQPMLLLKTSPQKIIGLAKYVDRVQASLNLTRGCRQEVGTAVQQMSSSKDPLTQGIAAMRIGLFLRDVLSEGLMEEREALALKHSLKRFDAIASLREIKTSAPVIAKPEEYHLNISADDFDKQFPPGYPGISLDYIGMPLHPHIASRHVDLIDLSIPPDGRFDRDQAINTRASRGLAIVMWTTTAFIIAAASAIVIAIKGSTQMLSIFGWIAYPSVGVSLIGLAYFKTHSSIQQLVASTPKDPPTEQKE